MEIRIEAHPSLSEAVANFLIEEGSPGIVQEEVKNPGSRKKERIIGYFPNDRYLKGKKKGLTTFLRSLRRKFDPSLRTDSRKVKEEKWAEAWKENFKTFHVTPGLVVKPPWEEYSAPKGEVVIVIDPGMAFGTGSHPSTQMCLEVLEQVIPSFSHSPSLMDVGTGSGILAIAGRKMGAHPIGAVDIDPVALQNARKNARANGIGKGIDFRLGSAAAWRKVFDIVVANLLPQELLRDTSSLPRRVASRGTLIVAGLLSSQKGEIARAFSSQGMRVRGGKSSKGWACLILEWPRGKRKR